LAAILLRFVAAYNLFDASLMVLASAIKGAGDTRFVMLVSLVMTTLLCVSTYLAVVKLGMGLDICWVLITAWVCILGIIFFFRFRGGKWKKMRVIDMVHVPPS
jgi:MATE family multidrug resistance protein